MSYKTAFCIRSCLFRLYTPSVLLFSELIDLFLFGQLRMANFVQPTSHNQPQILDLPTVCWWCLFFRIKKELLGLVTSLCQDVDYEVRACMCNELESIARSLGFVIIIKIFFQTHFGVFCSKPCLHESGTKSNRGTISFSS